MKFFYLILLLLFFNLISCTTLKFEEVFTNKLDYYFIARDKGIDNDRWIDRLYSFKVNINKFDDFKKTGVDLNKIYGNDYKSRALYSEIIIEGKILSKKENPSNKVMFHTEYLVEVKQVLKKQTWEISDTIKLKMMYGPVGDRYMAVSSGSEIHNVGEKVLLYLEPMEKTFKSYIDSKSDRLSKINADRNDPNIYQSLKKYIVKKKGIYDKTIGFIGSKSKVFKNIKKVLALNKIRSIK